MEEFEIKGANGIVKISLKTVYGFPKETCHWGGYDTKVEILIDIDDFKVNAEIYMSTGEIFNLCTSISTCNDALEGEIYFENYERNLEMNISYNVNGHIAVNGTFVKNNEYSNKLHYEFNTDQSYIQSSLKQLKSLTDKYGGMKGVK